MDLEGLLEGALGEEDEEQPVLALARQLWEHEQVAVLWVGTALLVWALLGVADWLLAAESCVPHPARTADPQQAAWRHGPGPGSHTASPQEAGQHQGSAPDSHTESPQQQQRQRSATDSYVASLQQVGWQQGSVTAYSVPAQSYQQLGEEEEEDSGDEQPATPATIQHVNTLILKRLWHDASLELLRLVTQDNGRFVSSESEAKALLNNHVKFLQKRANPAVVVEIAQHLLSHIPDRKQRITVLQELKKTLSSSDVAVAMCDMHHAELLLEDIDAMGVQSALALLLDVEELLAETAMVVPQEVTARCYQLLSECYALRKDLSSYQDATIKYLCNTDLSSIPEEEQKHIASELVVCALLSDDINTMAEMLCRSQRRVPLSTVAAATHLSESDAEQLVLQALARRAVDGSLERRTLCVERVRPTPAGPLQLQPHIKKLDSWINTVSETEARFAEEVDGLLTL